MEDYFQEQGTIKLVDFAPLIQLWAGICLLFFYEKFLENSPFEKQIQTLKALFKKFFLEYNGIIKEISYTDLDKYANDRWSDLIPTIRNIAIVSFTYSIVILCYIGINGLFKPNTGFYDVLIIPDIICFLYTVVSMLSYKKGWFHSYFYTIVGCVLLVLYFPVYYAIIGIFDLNFNWCNFLSDKWIIVITIISVLIGVAMYAYRYVANSIGYKYKKVSIKRASKNIKTYTLILRRRKKIKDLTKWQQRKIKKYASNHYLELLEEKDKYPIIKCMDALIRMEYERLLDKDISKDIKKEEVISDQTDKSSPEETDNINEPEKRVENIKHPIQRLSLRSNVKNYDTESLINRFLENESDLTSDEIEFLKNQGYLTEIRSYKNTKPKYILTIKGRNFGRTFN